MRDLRAKLALLVMLITLSTPSMGSGGFVFILPDNPQAAVIDRNSYILDGERRNAMNCAAKQDCLEFDGVPIVLPPTRQTVMWRHEENLYCVFQKGENKLGSYMQIAVHTGAAGCDASLAKAVAIAIYTCKSGLRYVETLKEGVVVRRFVSLEPEGFGANQCH